MKEYEEFTDSDDVLDSGIKPQLDKIINKLAMPKMVGLQLLGEKTVPKGFDKLTLRREIARMIALDFAEGDDIPDISVSPRWDNFDVAPTYFGGGDEITGQAIDDADFDLIREQLEGIADAMVIKSDARIWSIILNTTLVVDEAIAGGATDFDLAHGTIGGGPTEAIIGVVSITTTTVGVTWELDYRKGHIEFSADPGASTITYVYSVTRDYVLAVTDGEVSYNDLVNLRTAGRKQFISYDTLVADEETEGMLLKDDRFIHATALGDRVIMNGQIGKAAGMDILTTDTTYDAVPIALLKGPKFGTMVYKRKMNTRIDKLQKRPDDVWVQAWEKSYPAVIRSTWMRILINGQINAYTYTP